MSLSTAVLVPYVAAGELLLAAAQQGCLTGSLLTLHKLRKR
jgi:hypothetical protein